MRQTPSPIASFFYAVLTVFVVGPASSQTPVKVGSEIQLNTYTTGNQWQPRVAATR